MTPPTSVELSQDVQGWLDIDRPLFGEVLLDLALVTPDQLTDALAAQRNSNKPLGELLRAKGILSDANIAEALATQFELEVADLRTSAAARK